jgi:hypothetical protein
MISVSRALVGNVAFPSNVVAKSLAGRSPVAAGECRPSV